MKEKQKNEGLKLLAILLIIMIVTATFLGLYAWSRYRSSMPGDATADVAKWNFKIRAGYTEETPPKPFAITRTDNYRNVVEGRLAPGTFGEIPIFVDMTGTEVLARLDLSITITDCPRNIKFYASEEDRKNNEPMEFEQDTNGEGKYVSTISIIKYYKLSTVSNVHNETIYWKWAYETPDGNGSVVQGDEYDKEDSENDAQIAIRATGTEVLEIPPEYMVPTEEEKLAEAIQNPYDDNSIEPSPQDMFIYAPTGETVTASFASYTNNSVRIASKDGVRIAETTKTYGTAKITGFNYNYFKNLCGSYSGSNRVEDLSKFDGNIVIPATTRINGEEYIITSYDIDMNKNTQNYSDKNGKKLNKVITKVIIPKTIKSIGKCAFFECSGLTGSLTIPSNVTSIGMGAFYGCSGLTGKLIIPNSVTSISDSAFSRCSQITGIEIPNCVTSIGSYAFDGCSGLTGKVTISDNVTSIGSYAFRSCARLTDINVDANNTAYSSSYGVLLTKDGKTLIVCPAGKSGEYTIPSSVTDIQEYAFSECSKLTGNLTIPDNVTSIGESTFYQCSGLTGNLKIPDNVTSIGNYAFSECSGLTGNLTIPDNVTSIGNYAFNRCSGLTGNLIIGNSVKSIGNNTFKGCSGLTGTITIGERITNIGDNAFDGCSGLTGNLAIPNGVKKIGNYAFNGCSKLTGNLTIGNSVTSIGNYAFNGCSGLTGNLTIPDNVTSIGNYAFNGCSGLTGNLTIGNSVTSIGNYAFYGCSGLTGNLTIGNSVTSIGDSAFFECSELTGNLTIPGSVTSIGDSAFCGCSGLTGNLTIPGSVTSIENYTFCGCSGLRVITIANGVTSIGNYVFSGCSGLRVITIPKSVTSVGKYIFQTCGRIESIRVEHESKPDGWASNWFGGAANKVYWGFTGE